MSSSDTSIETHRNGSTKKRKINDTTPSGGDDSQIQQMNPQKDQIQATHVDPLRDSSQTQGEFCKLETDTFTTLYDRLITKITTDSESPFLGHDRKGSSTSDISTKTHQNGNTKKNEINDTTPSGGDDSQIQQMELQKDKFPKPGREADLIRDYSKALGEFCKCKCKRYGAKITTDSESPSGGYHIKEVILQQQSKLISEELSLVIGTFTEVEIRRMVANMDEESSRNLLIRRGFETSLTGSQREGFRLDSSDVDYMHWLPSHIVICDPSQESIYPKPPYTLILMDCEGTEPGHARLKLITPSPFPQVNSSCSLMNGEKYISTSLFRRKFLKDFQKQNGWCSHAQEHGPSSTLRNKLIENDHAFGLQLHTWPIVISEWLNRCRDKGWPPKAIIEESCHVVPTNSERLDPDRDCEWRISFSKAEQKIISSMDYCQFKCYGLLKIFLKEVINVKFDDPCLSSYIIKTAMFWIIQKTNHLPWEPSNLLEWFWVCFKLLTFWVYKGECPNFFIPQNNMFRFKVVGHRQAVLFDQMYELYCEGISCLVRCPTVANCLENAENKIIHNLINDIKARVKLNVSFYKEMKQSGEFGFKCEEEFLTTCDLLKNINTTKLNSLDSYGNCYQKKCLSSLFKNYAWFLVTQATQTNSEETRRQLHEQALSHLISAWDIGCASDIIYLAMYFYKESEYGLSLSCLHQAQENIYAPYVIYDNHVDEMTYYQEMAGLSIDEKRRKAWVTDIVLRNPYIYLDELVSEQKANVADFDGSLCISPFVTIHMLLVLIHHKLENTEKSQKSVHDLRDLLLNEQIPHYSRDTSWHIF